MLTMRAAAVLAARPMARPEEWQPVAAMGMALADGRPARKVPILGWVHQLTLLDADDPWSPLAGRDDAESIDGPEFPPEPPEPEKRGELRRLLEDAGMEISPAWLDGYLAAVVGDLCADSWIRGKRTKQAGARSFDSISFALRFSDVP